MIRGLVPFALCEAVGRASRLCENAGMIRYSKHWHRVITLLALLFGITYLDGVCISVARPLELGDGSLHGKRQLRRVRCAVSERLSCGS
jgi:hypothetical protein